MKVFEVWGELTLKDTLTQDLAAAQAKVTQFATGIQNALSRVGAGGISDKQIQNFTNAMNKQRSREWDKAFSDAAKKQKEILDFSTRMYLQKYREIAAAYKSASAENSAIDKARLAEEKSILQFKIAMNRQYAAEVAAARKLEISEERSVLQFKKAMATQRLREETAAQKQLTQELEKEQSIRNRLNNMNMSQFNNFLKTGKITDQISMLDAAMARLTRTFIAFTGITILLKIQQSFQTLVSTAMDFNSTVEKSRLGIASIISAQNEILTADGRRVQGVEKLNAAMQISSRLIQQLRIDNLQTTATFEQLLRVFQQGLGPGQAAGLGLDQIRQVTLGMVQAASALDIPLDLMAEEVRSVFRGQISTRNSLIATILGMDAQTIRSLQGNAQGLFDYLMGFLDHFTASGIESQKTWAGLLSNLKDVFSETSGVAFTGFFENAKMLAKDMIDSMMTFDHTSRKLKLNPEFLDGLKAVANILQVAVNNMYALAKGVGQTAGSSLRLAQKFAYPMSNVPTPVGEGGLAGLLGINLTSADISKLRKYQEMIMREVETFKERMVRYNSSSFSDYFGLMLKNPIEYLNRVIEDTMAGGNLKIGLQQLEKIRDALQKSGESTEDIDRYMNMLKDPTQVVSEEVRNAALGISDFELIQKRIVKLEQDWLEKQKEITGEIIKSASALYETELLSDKNSKNNEFVIKNLLEYRKKYTEIKTALEKEAGPTAAGKEAVANKMIEADLLLKEKMLIDNRNDALKEYNDIIEDSNRLWTVGRDLRRGFGTEDITAMQSTIASSQNEYEQDAISLLKQKLQLELDIRRIKNEPFQEIYSGAGGYATVIDWESLQMANSELKNTNELLFRSAENAKALEQKFNYLETARISDSATQLQMLLEKNNLTIQDYETLQKASGSAMQEILKLQTDSMKLDMDKLKIQQEIDNLDLSSPEGFAYYQFLQTSLGVIEQKIQNNVDKTNLWTQQAEEARFALSGMVPEAIDDQAARLQQVQDILLGIYDYSNIRINLDFDATPINNQLDSVIARMNQILQMQSQLRNSLPGSLGSPFAGQFEALQTMESDYIINFQGSYNPTLPLGKAIKDINSMLNSFPSGTTYQVDFLMEKMGMSGSEALGYMEQNSQLKSLYSQLQEAKEQEHYFRYQAYNGLSFGSPAMANWYADAQTSLTQQINQLELEMYATAADAYNNQSSSSSSSSSSSGTTIDLTVDIGPVAISLDGKNSREDAIILADRIDKEIAKKIKGNNSKITSALKEALK